MVLILAEMRFEDNGLNTSAKKFKQAITIINPVVMTQFFEAIYTSNFKCLIIAVFTGRGKLGHVSTYYRIIKTNS